MKINESEIKDFINSKIGIELQEGTFLFKDLGIDDFESISLMEDIVEKYQIDMGAFNPKEYFLSTLTIKDVLKNWYFSLFNKKRKFEYKAFTISHLCKVINNGKWIDPLLPETIDK